MWTSGVSMDIRVDTGGLGSLIRGGTGETFQMAFGGQGFVLIQPDEGVVDRRSPAAEQRRGRRSPGRVARLSAGHATHPHRANDLARRHTTTRYAARGVLRRYQMMDPETPPQVTMSCRPGHPK
jgi:hypothetical protein